MEGRMHLRKQLSRVRIFVIILAASILISTAAVHVHPARAQSNSATATSLTDSELVAQFRRVEVASVSDARWRSSGCGLSAQGCFSSFCHGNCSLHLGASLPVCRSAGSTGAQRSAGEP